MHRKYHFNQNKVAKKTKEETKKKLFLISMLHSVLFCYVYNWLTIRHVVATKIGVFLCFWLVEFWCGFNNKVFKFIHGNRNQMQWNERKHVSLECCGRRGVGAECFSNCCQAEKKEAVLIESNEISINWHWRILFGCLCIRLFAKANFN